MLAARYVFLAILMEMGWRRIAALTEEGHKYADYIPSLQDLTEKYGTTFVANRNIPNDAAPRMASVSHQNRRHSFQSGAIFFSIGGRKGN